MYLDHPEPFEDAWFRLEAIATPKEESIAIIAANLGDP
jgi:hypothetical protein